MQSLGSFSTVVTGTPADILGSSGLAVFTSYSDESVWTYNPYQGSHKNGSVIPDMLSVSQVGVNCTNDTPVLNGLTAANPPERITQSNNVFATLPSWSQYGTSGIGRLVTGGCALFAAYRSGVLYDPERDLSVSRVRRGRGRQSRVPGSSSTFDH